MMKKIVRYACLCLLLILCPYLTASALEVKDTIIFCHDDTAILSIAAFRGTLYSLRYEGVIAYHPQTGEEQLLTDAVSGYWAAENPADALLSDENGLYAFSYQTNTLVQLLDTSMTFLPAVVLQLDKECTPTSPFIQDGIFYMLEQTQEGQRLRGIFLTDHHTVETKVSSLCKIAACKDGQAIVVEQHRTNGPSTFCLSRCNLSSGTTIPLATIDTANTAIAYDPWDDVIYLAAHSELWAWTEDGGLQLAAHTAGGDSVAVAGLGMNSAAVLVDNSIVIRSTADRSASQTLSIREPYGRSENYRAYLAAHPDQTLLFKGDPSMTAEDQFIQDMTNQSDAIDLYVLSDINLLSTIYRKGFGVNLADHQPLRALVDDMYQPFKDLFLHGENILAVPKELYITMLGYDPKFFNQYGFEIPKTYHDLMRLTQAWLQDYAEAYDDVYFSPFANGITLQRLLERYADECTGSQQPLRFSDAEMAATLEAYLQADELYRVFFPSETYDLYVLNIIDLPHAGPYQYMPLSIKAANKPIISGTDIELTYFVVNPFSPHQQAAAEFIQSAAESWAADMRVLLLQSAAVPIERPEYQNEKEQLQGEIAYWKEQMAVCSPADALHIQDQLDIKETALQICEENRWQITQSEIDWYQSVVDSIVISPFNPLAVLQEKQPELYRQLTDKRIDAAHFLQLIDERIQMICLESQ